MILKIYLSNENDKLRASVIESIINIITDKKVSRRHDLYLLEFASRYLTEDDVKNLIPHFKKQMLRAPEVGCARLSALINGTVEGIGSENVISLSPNIVQEKTPKIRLKQDKIFLGRRRIFFF